MTRPWDMPASQATPSAAALSRRRFLRVLGATGVTAAPGAGAWWAFRDGPDEEILAAGRFAFPGEDRYPAPRHPTFTAADRLLTPEAAAARYCNFYEFTSTKRVWQHVERFQPTPWTLEVTGLVAQPRTFDLDDLVRAFPLEERVYRHRCVEAWAMVVPWVGFPLAHLLRVVEPLPAARFVRFVSFDRPEEAGGQRVRGQPWPYTEGLTLAEAANELAFLVTGMYGHPLLKQHGAPVRLVVPWKYGFKSAKSLVRIELTAHQPSTFWNTLAPSEYGFAANVDPEVPHPRWSQKTERLLGSGEVRATQLYNGYGEWVASLYRT